MQDLAKKRAEASAAIAKAKKEKEEKEILASEMRNNKKNRSIARKKYKNEDGDDFEED